ncbi:hypothetical protein BC943DRAFT_356051 [Umbelopsis sp. AD052]|nr:hypothetical protein BC943DRAFT_356051 [Umbelopsis sp. AD052]
MSSTAARHTEEDIHEVEVACYRTDYSDDAKWERLLELAQTVRSEYHICYKGSAGGSSQTDEALHHNAMMCVMEGPQFENLTAQDLETMAPGTFVVADQQSMQDRTFLLAHKDYKVDEETGDKSTEYVLKTGRYPAFDILAPLNNLPYDNMVFENFVPYDELP